MEESVGLGSRRTRSQGATEWSDAQSLILVNEIAAVDGDCLDTISSYQKWKIIAQNCTLLDVARTSSQCRRKWESLLVQYKKIKGYNGQWSHGRYWSLEPNQRKGLDLPVTFDLELFKAIKNLLRIKEAGSESDTENNPEDKTDAVETEAAAKSVSKRENRLSKDEMPVKRSSEVVSQKGKPTNAGIKYLEEESKPSKSYSFSRETEDAIRAAAALQENAEKIISMVKRTGNCENDSDADGVSIRTGDEVIICLGSIVSMLSQPCFDATRVQRG
ncbi:hypothetical protein SAY87_014658 [Trapa incisa]|uniref:Myb-like domain-containing protein n=1 Tax=Trapa incisa TaxID=236973 RepID=A0AAN7JKL9_9MYRT|nr:hypothetical protein SAY87_014648 [Trapa incisa]KAK4748072.1 hypothetical protein SAY87_014658 [Trapa incisa]